jgi:cephalosporin hydroxylase
LLRRLQAFIGGQPKETGSGGRPVSVFGGVNTASLRTHYVEASLPQKDYGTVRDYCESRDWMLELMGTGNDLRDLQRAWIVKTLLAKAPAGSRLLELVLGESIAAPALGELGYEVTVADLTPGPLGGTEDHSFDAIFSVAVLQSLSASDLEITFQAMKRFLRAGGFSLHCINAIIEGEDADLSATRAQAILDAQAGIAGKLPGAGGYRKILQKLKSDLETFYLSPASYDVVRAGRSYSEFPFRKIASLQTCEIERAADPGMIAAPAQESQPVMEESLDMPLRDVLPIMQERIMRGTTYWGVPALKNPNDFWVYQEIFYEMQPDVIIEIGNYDGGSTLALGHLCDLLGKGRILALDLSHSHVAETARAHPRITWLEGDACDLYPQVKEILSPNDRVLVIEDSAHTYENTLRVLRTYSGLIRPGDYFIVEDSNCHHGLSIGPFPGPYEAIEEFLRENGDFISDREKEGFLITWNPKGFLKRIK